MIVSDVGLRQQAERVFQNTGHVLVRMNLQVGDGNEIKLLEEESRNADRIRNTRQRNIKSFGFGKIDQFDAEFCGACSVAQALEGFVARTVSLVGPDGVGFDDRNANVWLDRAKLRN